MKRLAVDCTVLGFMLATFVLVGLWLATNSPRERREASVPTPAVQTNQNSQQYYLIHSLERWKADPFAHEEGLLFESRNSLGVPEQIAENFAELLPDFMFIGDDNGAREQFLVDQAFVFENPQHYFKTEIDECVQANGEKRIQAIVYVGMDGPIYGFGAGPATGKKIEATLSEIWQVDSNGGAPTLLERIRCGDYDGKEWYHSHPNLLYDR